MLNVQLYFLNEVSMTGVVLPLNFYEFQEFVHYIIVA